MHPSCTETDAHSLKLSTEKATPSAAVDYEHVKAINQRQKHRTKTEIGEVVKNYQAGATVYQLAKEFGCPRNTISGALRSAGIKMRLPP